MAATILDSAGVVVSKADLSECYDAKGALAYSGQLLTLAIRVLSLKLCMCCVARTDLAKP